MSNACFRLHRGLGQMGLTIVLVLCSSAVLSAQPNCTHYASPAGSQNGLSPSSPFQISKFWSVAKPGSTLCLLDGTYTGANSMITPPPGLSGTSQSRISISAINDGEALIDGQYARLPVQLNNNDYWIIEGVNVANSSGDEVIGVGAGADHNIIRRTIAWNAAVAGNSCVWWASNGNTGNLFEDVAGFGTGRKIFCNSQGGNNLTVRRAWGMWNKSTSSIYGQHVYTNVYNSYGSIFENVIATWQDDAGAVHPNSTAALLGGDWMDPMSGYDVCSNAKYLGSIAYNLASQKVPSNLTAGFYQNQYADCLEAKDVVSYMENNHLAMKLDRLTADTGYSGPSKGRHIYTNGTEIGAGGATIGTDWTVTNRATGANVAAVPNIWNGSGSTGARVCYRYVEGVLTGIPLWPWPMNQRIIDALITAGRAPIDVTKTMESIFGAIPATCKGSQSETIATGPVSPPSNLRALTTP